MAVELITTCRLCGKQILGNPMDVPIIGEPASAKTERFVMGLAQHIQKRHREIFDAMTNSAKMLMGFLALSQFNSQDKALMEMREMIRYDIHRTTRRVNIEDEHIRKAIEELGIDFPTDDRERIVSLIRDLRDLLTDSGPYSPKVNSPLIPASI